jgi:uncharacterized BrkB/YihY/UPF0761 family membrane protein
MLGGFTAFFTANIFANKQSPDVANILHHVIDTTSVSLLVSVGICTSVVVAYYLIEGTTMRVKELHREEPKFFGFIFGCLIFLGFTMLIVAALKH